MAKEGRWSAPPPTFAAMAKPKRIFVCSECGETTSRWAGVCPGCGAGGTLEEREQAATHARAAHAVGTAKPAEFVDLAEQGAELPQRISTGMPELDRVLGGGLVPASYIVLAGAPGAGKTTLASEVVLALHEQGKKVGYVSGEESIAQAGLRFERLAGERIPKGITISADTSVERVIEAVAAQGFDLLVVDSVQTMYSQEIPGAPGSISQIRECALKLMKAAKEYGTTIVLIGQVTKNDEMAGPRLLEHMVDCVLQFEGDRREQLRILRAIKNRFGNTDEIGVFEMTSKGLVGVADPSSLFLEESDEVHPGSCLTAVIEGTRPVLCEIQALCSPSNQPSPIRAARGIDGKRLQMLLAVMSRHLGFRLGSMDVFVNVSGGLKLDDPGADLAVCLALASTAGEEEVPLRGRLCAFGEVSLLGTVRPAPQAERRRREAERMGIEVVEAQPGDQLEDIVDRCLAAEVAT